MPLSRNKTALLCFAAIYLIWGSTYLAIRYALETLPPWGISAVRFFIAGAIMVVFSLLKKESRLSSREIKVSAISGLFLCTANAIVCVAEQWVPSGVAAVVIGAMPIWILLIGWLFFRQAAPTFTKILGAGVGLIGIAAIAAGDLSQQTVGAASFGTLYLVCSSWLWACGTLIQRNGPQISSPFKFSGVQMMSGSTLAIALSLIFEKPWAIDLSAISSASILAVTYLITFGSIVAFTAYAWLSRNVEPHLVSTYALVNPLIAVALGSIFYSEPLSVRFLFGAVLVLIGLALLVFKRSQTQLKGERI